MKRINMALPMAALLLAIGASAFTIPEAKPLTNRNGVATAYFHLNASTAGAENTLSNWVYDGSTPISCPPGSSVLCRIEAPVDGSNQIDESQLQSPINMRTDPAVTNRVFKP